MAGLKSIGTIFLPSFRPVSRNLDSGRGVVLEICGDLRNHTREWRGTKARKNSRDISLSHVA